MSFTKGIEEALSVYRTYPQIKNILEHYAKQGASEDEIREGWVKWGRRQFAQRLLNTACLVVTNATYGETTSYTEVLNTAAKGGSHNTMYSLLDHFSNLCNEAGWLPYGVCIVDKTGATPSGFEAWYRKTHAGISTVDVALLKAECFTEDPPSAVEIATRVTAYIHRNRL